MSLVRWVALSGAFAAMITGGTVIASNKGVVLLGGENNTNRSGPPIAYLFSANGQASLLPPAAFPDGGYIYSVAITDSGAGLIGGMNFGGVQPPIAYLLSPSGTITSLLDASAFPNGGFIYSVAMAQTGEGIIGGQNSAGPPIASFVSSNGTLTPIVLEGDSMYSSSALMNNVAIASSGIGILGGQSDVSPTPPLSYSVASDAVASFLGPPEPDFPSGAGILSVSIAENGAALLGGINYGSGPPILYRLYPDGTFTNLSTATGLPASGYINSVSIAENGMGLIGGTGPTYPIACFVAPDGALTVLGSGIFPAGSIYSVAINNSCAGIIGGQSGAGEQPPIAYLVAPNGALTTLGDGVFPPSGVINSVAISESGVGLIGGQNNPNGSGSAIAYLVAPNGTLTSLSSNGAFSSSSTVSSVALSDAIAPQSFGPYSSLANALFALTHTLEDHYTGRKTFFKNTNGAQIADLDLLAGRRLIPPKKSPPPKPCPIWSVWGGPFGALIYQDAKKAIPAFSDEIAGVIAAAEYNGIKNVAIGGGLAYAFTFVNYKESVGHASINQEYALIYANFNRPYFFFNAALWGGLYQLSNKRHTLGFITSTSNPKGWLLSPHVELSTPFLVKGDWFGVDPFAMVDWANSWQDSFREKGRSGLNISLNSQYSSLLRSEIGVRFYETLKYGWGCLKIEEKASYVNKAPFHTDPGTAAFIGAFSSFGVETFSSSVQNLGLAQIAFHFTPSHPKYPYGSIDYQGEFGSSFQSHLLVLELGQSF
ncbi:MAG: autotransporter outer membrane beta-barrel domain-containing protein [Chlamydiales bacterium]